MSKKTAALNIAASVTAIMMASAAAAQNSSAPVAAETFGIEDIIVTAQKRSENLQKTPAAVTAVSGDTLVSSGIANLAAAQELVPGARFHQEGNTTQVFLRGIGSNLDFANVEPSVAFNFNGVAIPREATSVPLYDIERFEVLPGPQGTLYGGNAIGGTINVSFKRPEFATAANGTLEVGNYNLVHGTLVGNTALSDQLAVRIGADYHYRKGFMKSGSDSKDDISGRIGLLFKPNSDFSVYLWGATTHKYGYTPNLVNKGSRLVTDSAGNPVRDGGGNLQFVYDENAFLLDPWNDLRPGVLAETAPFGQPNQSNQNYHNWMTGAQIEANLSDTITLTDIIGYVYLDAETKDYWLGVLPAYKLDQYRNFSNELRLSGDSGRLKWLAGLFTYRNVGHGRAVVGTATGSPVAPAIPGTPFPFDSSHVDRNLKRGVAVFGQGTYSISDALRVTIGARYGIDKRTARGRSLVDQTTPYSFDKKFTRFDYKAGFEYDVAPHIMLYATYQTGYQPGTFNEVDVLPSGGSNLVKSGKMKGISGGFKSRFFDNKLQINNETFYYIYNDLAIQAYDASKLFNEIFNAKKVTIPGNQLDVLFQPTRDTRLNVSVSYIRARNKDFITPQGENFNGLAGPYAADWTISGGVSQDFHLGSGYIRAAADARYESEWFADFVHNLGTRQKPYAKVNASLTYYADDNRWNIGVWGKNLTDEAVIAATAAAGIPGPATAYMDAPRTYGVRAGFNF
jgi:iron complex outermembrane receptor protein